MYQTIKKKGPAFKNGQLKDKYKEKYVGGPGNHSKVNNYDSSSILSLKQDKGKLTQSNFTIASSTIKKEWKYMYDTIKSLY